jgi:DNA-binding NarL/FixJ family response regulator
MKQLTQPQINIAVIDGSQAFQFFIKSILEENEYLRISLQCSMGLQFFNEYKHQKIDVIVLDIDIPGEDGLQVAAKLKKECEHIPVIIFSALNSTKFNAMFYSLGVKMCLLKEQFDKLEIEILALFKTPNLTELDKYNLNNSDYQLLQLICNELTIDQIAEKLNVGNEAVKKRKAKLADKMQIENRDAQFLKWALKKGHYQL